MKIRTFIAIPISLEIKKIIYKMIEDIRIALPNSSIRWVSPNNYHLTLKFLGSMEYHTLEQLSSEVGNYVKSQNTFNIHLSKLGAFPNRNNPRVLWIGLQAPDNLFNAQKAIAALSEKFGIPKDNKPYSPHFTIGRVSNHLIEPDRNLLHEIITSSKIPESAIIEVNEMEIIKSDLHRSGPVYSTLFKFQFSSI